MLGRGQGGLDRRPHIHPSRLQAGCVAGQFGVLCLQSAMHGVFAELRLHQRSLFGDLSAYGPDAVRFYTKRKTITQRWPSAGVREGALFSFPSTR